MKQKQGELGIIGKKDFGEIGRYAFMLNKGGVAGPIPTDQGYSIIMLVGYEDNFTPFENVKDEVKKMVDERKKNYVFQKLQRKYSKQPNIVIHEDVLLHGF